MMQFNLNKINKYFTRLMKLKYLIIPVFYKKLKIIETR